MKFVGVDLAWGEVAWTGTAVVDRSRQLLQLGRERTDQDVATALRPHLDGPVLVSIDAPLIVPNTRVGARARAWSAACSAASTPVRTPATSR